MATRRWLTTGLALGALAACAIIFSTDEPLLPVNSADGVYYNRCCGLLTLRGSELRAGNDAASYVIERDKVGAYALPNALVSVASRRLDIDRGASPYKLRLDRERNPSSIVLMDRGNGTAFTFVRRDGR